MQYVLKPTFIGGSGDPDLRPEFERTMTEVFKRRLRAKHQNFKEGEDSIVLYGTVTRLQPRVTHHEKHNVKNPNFQSRRNRGEIIVAPYTVQHITVNYHDRFKSEKGVDEFHSIRNIVDTFGFDRPSELKRKYGDGITALPEYWKGRPVYVGYTAYSTNGEQLDNCLVVNQPSLPTLNQLHFTDWDEGEATGLITSAFADINSGEWDMLTSLAESKETVKFLADKLVEAAKLLLRIRRPHQLLHGVGDLTGKAGSRWLEYRYAIMPLIYEIEDIKSALENLGRLYNKVSSKSTSVTEGSDIDGWQKAHDEVLLKYSVMIKRRYDPSTILSATDQMVGFNPFVTAWELVPFSFVIDWFINVGDLLAATTHIPDYCDQGATLAIRVNRAARFMKEYKSSCGELVTNAMLLERSYYRRVIGSGEAGFQFSPDLSWRRYLDAFALSWGPLRKALNSNQLTRRVLQ